MDQNNQFQNKSLPWIIFTIEANIATIAIFIGFSQMFFTLLPDVFLRSQIFRISLSIISLFLLSIWATRRGVKTVLKKTPVKQEDILKISFWVGFIPFLLAVALFTLGKIVIPDLKLSSLITNSIDSIFSAASYGFLTHFWLKRLNVKIQPEFSGVSAPTVSVNSISSQLKKGLIIGLVLAVALATYAFLGQMFQQKAIEKLLKSENRDEIINESLKQFLPPSDNSANETATCRDEPEGTPVITSLSGYFGSVGAKLEIMGCNFSGFEGDKDAWIENSQGVKGLLRGEAESTSKLLKITLNSPLCQKDTSYSGLPCDAWLNLTPGAYKIYALPWGKKSNEINFKIK